MASTAWPGPAFTGIGLRDHMDKVEETFITNASKLGRVPQAGEVEYVVLDVTKKTLFLQSCVQAVVNRLRRAELVGAADMRMEVQMGPVTALNPREMVGWAAATWDQCVQGLYRFYTPVTGTASRARVITRFKRAEGLARRLYRLRRESPGTPAHRATPFPSSASGGLFATAGQSICIKVHVGAPAAFVSRRCVHTPRGSRRAPRARRPRVGVPRLCRRARPAAPPCRSAMDLYMY